MEFRLVFHPVFGVRCGVFQTGSLNGLGQCLFFSLRLFDRSFIFLPCLLLLPDLLPDGPLFLPLLLLQPLNRHGPFEFFQPCVKVFFVNPCVLENFPIMIGEGVHVLDFLDQLSLIGGLEPGEDGVDLPVEGAKNKIDGILSFPPLGIVAGGSNPSLFHDLRSLSGDLQSFTRLVEAIFLSQFVEHMGSGNHVRVRIAC